MLFLLTKQSIAGGVEQQRNSLELREFAEELGIARYKGFHHVAGPPVLLHDLRELDGLSERARQGLRDAAAWSQKELTRAGSLTPRVEIVDAVPTGPRNDGVFEIAWKQLASRSVTHVTVLGGENLVDARYWEMLAAAWLTTEGSSLVSEAKVRVELLSLGGGNAFSAVKPALAAGKPIVAVTDSDKEFPEAPNVGATAGNLIKWTLPEWEQSGGPWTPFGILVIPGHAAENLLPAPIVAMVSGTRGAPAGEILDRLLASGFFCTPAGSTLSARYTSLAKPHCPNSVPVSGDKKRIQHHSDALASLVAHRTSTGLDVALSGSDGSCAQKCQNPGPPPACWLLNVGKKLLPAVVEAGEAIVKQQGPEALAAMLPFGTTHELSQFCGRVALWGLGCRGPYA